MTSAPAFQVIPLGTGNAFSSRRYFTSIVLEADGAHVLIDCPEPFFRICADASRSSGIDIDPDRIDHIVLTHLHADHCSGLESFGFWRKFQSKRGVRPRIYTSPEVADRLWERLSSSMGEAVIPNVTEPERYELEDYFDIQTFPIGDTFEAAGITIETRRTQHSVPTFALRASYRERNFGYSCDTCFDPELIRFLESCDLIFHECDDGFHTPLEKLEALPESTRRKIRLVHLNDEFNGSRNIEPAEAGKIYEI